MTCSKLSQRSLASACRTFGSSAWSRSFRNRLAGSIGQPCVMHSKTRASVVSSVVPLCTPYQCGAGGWSVSKRICERTTEISTIYFFTRKRKAGHSSSRTRPNFASSNTRTSFGAGQVCRSAKRNAGPYFGRRPRFFFWPLGGSLWELVQHAVISHAGGGKSFHAAHPAEEFEIAIAAIQRKLSGGLRR
jgi:hypothetical protein